MALTLLLGVSSSGSTLVFVPNDIGDGDLVPIAAGEDRVDIVTGKPMGRKRVAKSVTARRNATSQMDLILEVEDAPNASASSSQYSALRRSCGNKCPQTPRSAAALAHHVTLALQILLALAQPAKVSRDGRGYLRVTNCSHLKVMYDLFILYNCY